MDLSMSSSNREDPFASDSIFSQQDLPVVPNDNPETYCRLCLTTPDVVPLFPTGTDPNVYVLELIGQYIGIGLTIEDDITCAVCQSCQQILDQFDLFRQNCLKVDIAIRRRRLGLDRVVVKSEQLHDDDDGEELELPYVRLDNRVYQCRVCQDTFRSMSLFMTHCKEEHPEEAKMYKCKHCPKAFMTKTARLQHIRSHQPTNAEGDLGVIRVQVCEKCMVTFESYKLLKDHIKEQHTNDPKQESLVCGTCSRQFSRITILRNHILRVHLGKQPHMCKRCGTDFAYAQQLVAHLKTEHGISPDEFGQFAEDHLDDEEGVPAILGPQQGSANISDTHRDETQPMNTSALSADDLKQKNRYSCMECNTTCDSTEALRIHRKIHQDPTWWKCNHCRNFVKDQHLHIKKKHPTIAESELEASYTIRYRCWMCRMYFKTLHQMEVHANVKHQVPLPDHHVASPPIEELEEGEIRPGMLMGAPAASLMPPTSTVSSMLAPPSTLIHAAAAGLPSVIPQPLTVQPPLPFAPEHLPLLLSQLENGALDYLREFSRLMDPNNQLGLAAQLDIKPNVAALNAAMAMDLSGNSALNLTNSTSALNSTRNTNVSTEVAEAESSESEDDTFTRLDNRTYQCKFCPETFRHLQLIRKHTKAQHPEEWKSFKCVHCSRRFPSAPMRDRHAHFHSVDHPCKCTECDQMYTSKKRLEKHFAIYHDRNSHSFSLQRFKCGSCEMTFVEKKYYDLHSRIYHEKKPQRFKNLSEKIQVCERCFTKFDSKESLMNHIRLEHKGDPPLKNYICSTCQKDLKTVTLLRIHILVVHMGISPFVCQHCNADFDSRHWLLKHMEKEHSEIALYKCPCCEESFTTEARLVEHKDKVHTEVETEYDAITGSTVYPCTKCEKKLTSKDLLEKHLIKAHPSYMMMYKCPLCTQPIRYRKQHMRVHHDTEYIPKEHPYQVRYKCHCCSKMFQQKRNLLAHQNSLAYQCNRCQMRFKTKKNLQTHTAAHRTNKSLKCEDCGLDFGYRARLDTHRQRYHSPSSTQVLKIINCPYCPKLFISPSNRERHIAANHVQSEFKVNCNHCPVQVTDTAQLRKHYKAVHPEERVTFKCPGCERFYLNLSSFKDHYKKHKEEANKSSNSTVDGSDVEGGMDNGVQVKQEVQDAEKIPSKREPKSLSDLCRMVVEVKQERDDGDVASTATEEAKPEDGLIKVDGPSPENADAVKTECMENGESATATGPDVKADEEPTPVVESKENAEVVNVEPENALIPGQSMIVHPEKDVEGDMVKVEASVLKDSAMLSKDNGVLADKLAEVAENKMEESAVPENDDSKLVDKPLEPKAIANQQESAKDAEDEAGKEAPNTVQDIANKDDSTLADNAVPQKSITTQQEPVAASASSASLNEEKTTGDAEAKPLVQDLTAEHKEETTDTENMAQEFPVSSKPIGEIVVQSPIPESLMASEEPKHQEQMAAAKKTSEISEAKDEAHVEEKPTKETASVENLKTINQKAVKKRQVRAPKKTTQQKKAVLKAKSMVKKPKSGVRGSVVPASQASTVAADPVEPEESSAKGKKSALDEKSVGKEGQPEEKTEIEGATDTTSNKNSEEQKEALAVEKLKDAEEKPVGKEPKIEQKKSAEETTSEVPVNESKTADVQPEQGIAVGNDVVLSESATVTQVETSSDKEKTESEDAAVEERNEAEVAQKKNIEEEKIKPNEAEVPSIDEKQEKEDLPESSKKSEELSEPSQSKRKLAESEDSAGPSNTPDVPKQGQSVPEQKESPTKPEEPHREDLTHLDENSKDQPAPSEDLRSANVSPTSTAVDSPYTIVESSNEASEISETSSVTSERSTTKARKSAPPTGEKRRISTRNILKRKKRLMVLIDPVDVDKLVELSRGSSASPSLERVTRKGSASTTRESSSESQPGTEDQQRPAKRLRRERRTPNLEGGVAGDS